MAAWDLVGLILVLHHVLMVAANMEGSFEFFFFFFYVFIIFIFY